ncbi:hypothetical protein JZ785_21390 [Alicyclobacillus curvatus]|nr:hypothetical protein JZ785_21390 [Alicyclobacillus curvatus]
MSFKMSVKKCSAFIMMALTVGIIGFVVQPAPALASSQNQSARHRYSASEIQNALRQNIERHYYMSKDEPIKNPEHKVTRVKVLYYIQHDQKVILVGSCLVDGKEQLITGGLGRDKSRGELVFGGGWTQTSTIRTRPLYWGMGANRQELYISGKAFDKSITQVRLTPIPNGRPVIVAVNPEGYFATAVPVASQYSHGPRLSIEGLNSDGKVVYSALKPPKHQQG